MNDSIEHLKEYKGKIFKSIFLLSPDHFDIFHSNLFFPWRTYINNIHLFYSIANFNNIGIIF